MRSRYKFMKQGNLAAFFRHAASFSTKFRVLREFFLLNLYVIINHVPKFDIQSMG